jgi:hypothetical protein
MHLMVVVNKGYDHSSGNSVDTILNLIPPLDLVAGASKGYYGRIPAGQEMTRCPEVCRFARVS